MGEKETFNLSIIMLYIDRQSSTAVNYVVRTSDPVNIFECTGHS